MELKTILEAILFSAQKPLSVRELREILARAAESEDPETQPYKKVKEDDLKPLLQELEADHNQAGRGYQLACVAGAWQIVSRQEFAPWLKAMFGEKARPAKLSQPALETLAIIAYRQPVTRAEIEQIRGVSVDGVMQTLLDRGFIEQAGRAEVVGRPQTYATTAAFLEHFGLRSLDDLPAADELRRIPVKKQEPLSTAQEGLATPPPDTESGEQPVEGETGSEQTQKSDPEQEQEQEVEEEPEDAEDEEEAEEDNDEDDEDDDEYDDEDDEDLELESHDAENAVPSDESDAAGANAEEDQVPSSDDPAQTPGNPNERV